MHEQIISVIDDFGIRNKVLLFGISTKSELNSCNDLIIFLKIFGFCTDSAANISAAIDKIPSKIRISCAAHRLNSIVNDILYEKSIKQVKKNNKIVYVCKDFNENGTIKKFCILNFKN